MAGEKFLTETFEVNRRHLNRVAYRMLGSRNQADDAVQEAWLRLAHTDVNDVGNLRGWLTTVVARICLDMLRAGKARREEQIGAEAVEIAGGNDAERDAMIADSVGVAMLVVLETLAPAERVAFVLHDMFDVPFDDIAPIVGRSPAAARQLASRARRRVQGAPAEASADQGRQREVVEAFLAASRGGDFSALLAVLDPNIVLRADAAAIEMSVARASAGTPVLAPEIHGLEAVGKTFFGRARAARMALVDGEAGLVFVLGGRPQVIFDFVVEYGRIVEINLIADANKINAFDLQY
jgi:RNA polymerase sigma-70 factor, ECF subfamily